MDLSKSFEFFNPDKHTDRIHIIGVGSIGSTVAELLARFGLKKFSLYDFDTVEPKNIVNQMFTTRHIGMEKTEAVKEMILGYAMIAHSFSTEYGRPCIWIEDLYLLEEARGNGFASQFFEFLTEKYSDHILRLESENENEHAMEVYKRKGFSEMPYVEMYRK